jgi:GxxExxY protein
MSELLFRQESYDIIGAAIEVHKQLGCGFVEPVYQEAFAEELKLREIPFEQEKVFTVTYKGKVLPKEFRADFVCYNQIIVELKAVSEFAEEHYAQVYNYLKASGMQLGLLINFGKTSLEYKRLPASHKFLNR